MSIVCVLQQVEVKTDAKVVEKKVEVVAAAPPKTVEVSMSWAGCGVSICWAGCRADVLGAMQITVLLSARDVKSVLLLSGMADLSMFCAQLPCRSRLL